MFFVPLEARWAYLQAQARQPKIGMFVQSEKFVKEHQGRVNDISIYGQESNQTTWRLAKMNLAIRGIDSSQVKWNNEGSFLNDAHKDLKADFIIANPPFNDSDWSGEILFIDARNLGHLINFAPVNYPQTILNKLPRPTITGATQTAIMKM